MEYKDKTITHLEEFSLAPHLNYTTTTKIGEAFKMKKPYPCTITWIKTTDVEFVTRIEINGKIVLYKYLFNNFGFTKICTIEGGTLMSKEIFTKMNPDINGFYELEKEENLHPLLCQMMPDLKVDDFERMKKRRPVQFPGYWTVMKKRGICLTWKEET